MSNTSVVVITADPLIVTLNLIQLNIGQYLYPVIFILGNIGSVLNIVILTRRVYLQNSCSCYILASSVINLLIMNIVVLFHMLAYGFNIDPTTTSLFFCRFRQYLSHVTTVLSRLYIVLACVDRWAVSSLNAQRRNFSRIQVARILIPSVGIGWCIVSLHIPLYLYIVHDRCVVVSNVYAISFNISNTIVSGLLTPIFMIIFGFLTIRNLKRSRQRINIQMNINPMSAINQQTARVNTKSREYGVSIMILFQLVVYFVTCLPFPMYLLYCTVTIQQTKSNVQLALDRFYGTIAYVLSNINFSATFYIYILTTRVFRKDLKKIFRKNRLFRICFCIE